MSFSVIADFYRLSSSAQRSVAARTGLIREEDSTDQREAAPLWMLRAKTDGLIDTLAKHVDAEPL